MVTALGLLLGNVAEAGNLTLGIGLGALVDLPDVGESAAKEACNRANFTEYKVMREDLPDLTTGGGGDCKAPLRGGGQLLVPIRIHLGPLASLKVTPGMQAVAYGGSVSWEEPTPPTPSTPAPPPTTLMYAGHAAYVLRPQLAVGGEFAFSPKGITPYLGAGVSAGLNVDIHSLGPNADDRHGDSIGAYETRDKSEVGHCNGQRGTCKYDAVNTSFGLGAEVSLGVRTAARDQPGFFVEGAFQVLGLKAGRSPDHYAASTTLGGANLNNVGLTAGVLLPL